VSTFLYLCLHHRFWSHSTSCYSKLHSPCGSSIFPQFLGTRQIAIKLNWNVLYCRYSASAQVGQSFPMGLIENTIPMIYLQSCGFLVKRKTKPWRTSVPQTFPAQKLPDLRNQLVLLSRQGNRRPEDLCQSEISEEPWLTLKQGSQGGDSCFTSSRDFNGNWIW
jgi:hypothetical protein